MKSIRQFKNKKITGFTLIELIVSIVILGIIAMMTSSFFKPAVDSYVSSRNRANLTEMADVALRNISREVQNAVPNSVRVSVKEDKSCVEFIPSKSGGVFVATRPNGEDKVNSFATLDESADGKKLDILAISPNREMDLGNSDAKTKPAEGDFIAIGAMSYEELYGGEAIAKLDDVDGFKEPAESGVGGTLTFEQKPTFSRAYDGNRFHVIDKDKQAIAYICDNDEKTLYKKVLKLDDDDYCPKDDAAVVVDTVVVDNVSSCNFTYDVLNDGYTGYLNVSLGLTQKGETINLRKGIHVNNLP